jgi:hypothetical protein
MNPFRIEAVIVCWYHGFHFVTSISEHNDKYNIIWFCSLGTGKWVLLFCLSFFSYLGG